MNKLAILLILVTFNSVAWASSPLGQSSESSVIMPGAPASVLEEERISPLGDDDGEIIERVELDLYEIISSRELGTRVYIEEGVTTVEKKDGTFYINTEGINPDGTGVFEIYDISGNEETNNE